ncbi:MAG: carboxylating nicotinate-nucleotide diphosphorylase [archaeon]
MVKAEKGACFCPKNRPGFRADAACCPECGLDAAMKKKLLAILKDDIGVGDVTGDLLLPEKCSASVVVKEDCIVAGLEEAVFLFRSQGVEATPLLKDGCAAKKGSPVLSLAGLNRKILAVERTALNVLGRMSGIAATCAVAKGIAGGGVMIALTRKTMPGFNLFEKKAACLAGVWPHRINLNSFVLLKDNHLPFFGSAFEAVAAARKKHGKKMLVEVEVETMQQAFDAARAKPDIIMLDNFSAKHARIAVKRLRPFFGGKIELSGGITLGNLRRYAMAKPDIISMGCLTHSTGWRDFSLRIEK